MRPRCGRDAAEMRTFWWRYGSCLTSKPAASICTTPTAGSGLPSSAHLPRRNHTYFPGPFKRVCEREPCMKRAPRALLRGGQAWSFCASPRTSRGHWRLAPRACAACAGRPAEIRPRLRRDATEMSAEMRPRLCRDCTCSCAQHLSIVSRCTCASFSSTLAAPAPPTASSSATSVLLIVASRATPEPAAPQDVLTTSNAQNWRDAAVHDGRPSTFIIEVRTITMNSFHYIIYHD